MNSLATFVNFIDPHVFLKVVSAFTSEAQEQQVVDKLRFAALIRTHLISDIQSLYEQSFSSSVPRANIEGIVAAVQKANQDINTPEVKQFLQLIEDVHNAEQLSVEEIKSKFSGISEKQKPTRQILQKYVVDKVIQQNLSLVEKAFKSIVLLYNSGNYDQTLAQLEHIQFFIESNERLEHLTAQSQWARLNITLIKIFSQSLHTEENSKRINTVLSELKGLSSQLDRQANQAQFKITQSFLRQRADILHIALLLTFVSAEPDFDQFLEIYSSEEYLKVIFTLNLDLLKYVTFALLLSKNRNQGGELSLDDLASILESHRIKDDGLLKFIQELLTNFDFDSANKQIPKIEQQLNNNVILRTRSAEIVQSVKLVFFTTYIRIFDHIEIAQYAQYLGLSEEDTEIWIVDALRQQNLSAQVQGPKVFINQDELENQQDQITKMCKDVIPRTEMLVRNLKQLLKEDKN